MSEWRPIARLEDLPIDRGRLVELAGHELAVFRLSASPGLIVVGNSCPHAGGNLAAGAVADGCVTCPWHHWVFDLRDGRCPLSEAVRLRGYESRVVDGVVEVRV
ncbi:MAG: nitrite reductase (NAD(P)H) small subunit [Phycisphaerae bacterium]